MRRKYKFRKTNTFLSTKKKVAMSAAFFCVLNYLPLVLLPLVLLPASCCSAI
jgi:dolichol kinase